MIGHRLVVSGSPCLVEELLNDLDGRSTRQRFKGKKYRKFYLESKEP